ncbi:MAG: hypothetical protein GY772_31610, partial [bacterium]|nr:hypothetical protein [bacterium]
MAGAVRGEALGTRRGAWYVCFPDPTGKGRLVTFRESELVLAERVLEVFRRLHSAGVTAREVLQHEGTRARATLRQDPSVSVDGLLEAALAAEAP